MTTTTATTTPVITTVTTTTTTLNSFSPVIATTAKVQTKTSEATITYQGMLPRR